MSVPLFAVSAAILLVEVEPQRFTVPELVTLHVFQVAPDTVIPFVPPARFAVFPEVPVRLAIVSRALPPFVIVKSPVNWRLAMLVAALMFAVIPAPAVVIVPFPEYAEKLSAFAPLVPVSLIVVLFVSVPVQEIVPLLVTVLSKVSKEDDEIVPLFVTLALKVPLPERIRVPVFVVFPEITAVPASVVAAAFLNVPLAVSGALEVAAVPPLITRFT